MHIVRFTIGWILFFLLAIGLAFYGYAISQGDLPPPDIEKLRKYAETLAAAGGAVGILAMAVLALLAAVAPLIYAARSGDAFTVLFSLVALLLVVALLVTSRTIVDMVLAAIVYFTSAIVAVIVFSTSRITDSLTSVPAILPAPKSDLRR